MKVAGGILAGTDDIIIPFQVDPTGAIAINHGGHIGAPYTKWLTAIGDGTGDDNLIGNYSAAVTDFWYQIPLGMRFDVATVVIQVSDDTSFNQNDYGGIPNGITNGVQFFYNAGAGDIPLIGGRIIRHNKDWYRLTPSVNKTQWSGTAQTLAAEINLSDGYGIYLMMGPGTKFIVRLHDNFTGLTDHSFCLRGKLYPENPALINYLAADPA
jgi:hypothetical protein